MTAHSVISNSFSKVFFTIILLNRSAKRAEAAMLEGIESLNIDADANENLLRTSIAAAVQAERRLGIPPQGEIEEARSILPRELRRVLLLRANLRLCFVMRVLAAIPGEECARLLRLTSDEVEEFTCSALQALTEIARNEKSAPGSTERATVRIPLAQQCRLYSS